MAGPSRVTDWVCSEGHEWYAWSKERITRCPYPKCNGVVRAVRGPLVKKNTGVKT